MQSLKTNGETSVLGEEHWDTNSNKRSFHDMGCNVFTLKLIGLITAPWVLIFLPMILTSSFIIFGLAYIGFNKLEEEEE